MNNLSFLLILFSLCSNFLSSQTININSFNQRDLSNSFELAMNSKYDTIFFDKENSPYVLKPMRFQNIKNKIIILEKGVEFKALSGAFPQTNDALIKFMNCDGISIFGNGATFSMNKAEYTNGEWRHVIRIMGSRNILLKDLILKDSGGDGIVIGEYQDIIYSNDIIVDNIKSLNNKRQGISIISAKNVLIKNSTFAETVGIAPGAGLDIEPNGPQDIIENVRFENCIFRDNYYAGINLGLVNLTSNSKPISIIFSNCVLTNNFCYGAHKVPSEIIIKSNKLNPVNGFVLFENCSIEGSQWGFLYAQINAAGFDVEFQECSAKNICKSGERQAIYLETPHYREITDLGGIKFGNISLDYDDDVPAVRVRGAGRGAMRYFRDVEGKFILTNNKTIALEYIHHNPVNNKNVSLDFIYVKK